MDSSEIREGQGDEADLVTSDSTDSVGARLGVGGGSDARSEQDAGRSVSVGIGEAVRASSQATEVGESQVVDACDGGSLAGGSIFMGISCSVSDDSGRHTSS